MPVRSVPVVSDVQQVHATSSSYPSSSVYSTGAHMPASVYSSGYMQSVPSTVANTVYSTGYVQTVPPQQFYSGR